MSFIPENANQDFYKPYLQDYADIKKNFYPHEYKQFGKYSWIPISDFWKEKIRSAVLDIQEMCVPTMSQLSN